MPEGMRRGEKRVDEAQEATVRIEERGAMKE